MPLEEFEDMRMAKHLVKTLQEMGLLKEYGKDFLIHKLALAINIYQLEKLKKQVNYLEKFVELCKKHGGD